MKFPGEKTLFLKRDCKVMLVWNRSDALKNGSMGRFKSVDEDKLLIYFEKVGAVGIERVTLPTLSRLKSPVVLSCYWFCNVKKVSTHSNCPCRRLSDF